MFKKLKELKFKIKIMIIAIVCVLVSTVILAVYSTIKVIQLENMFEEHIHCGNIQCDHMM